MGEREGEESNITKNSVWRAILLNYLVFRLSKRVCKVGRNHFDSAINSTMSPQNSYVKALTPNVTVFGDRIFKK